MNNLRVFILLLIASFALVACGAGIADDSSDEKEIVIIIEGSDIAFDTRDLAIINEDSSDKQAYERWLREETGDENPPAAPFSPPRIITYTDTDFSTDNDRTIDTTNTNIISIK